MARRALALAALLLAGCPTVHDARYCDASRPCSGTAFPFCDLIRHECESDPGDGGGMRCTSASDCPADLPECTGSLCAPCAPSAISTTCSAEHPTQPVCGPNGRCVECAVDGDCAAKTATPYCGATGTCVQCKMSSDCTPLVCGSDGACRGCQANGECPSGICDITSRCIDASLIALVDNGNMTVAMCNSARTVQNGQTPTTAYCDIAAAVGAREYILVAGHGSTAPYGPVSITMPTTIVGPGGSAASPAVVGTSGASPPPVVHVSNTNATIDGLEITSGKVSDGISCSATVAGYGLIVRNAFVHDNKNGILDAGCDLTVADSEVSTNDAWNLTDGAGSLTPSYTIQHSKIASGGAGGANLTGNITVDRSVFANNLSGNALQLNKPTFDVTNSFFYLNGKAVALNTTSTAATGIFQFNTVVKNSAGITCVGANIIQSSIVWGNMDGPIDMTSCMPISVVTDGGPTPAFVNISSTASYDFHLAVDTPAHLAANQACCIDKVTAQLSGGSPPPDHDVDSSKRPKGAGWDIGAHEAQ